MEESEDKSSIFIYVNTPDSQNDSALCCWSLQGYEESEAILKGPVCKNYWPLVVKFSDVLLAVTKFTFPLAPLMAI